MANCLVLSRIFLLAVVQSNMQLSPGLDQYLSKSTGKERTSVNLLQAITAKTLLTDRNPAFDNPRVTQRGYVSGINVYEMVSDPLFDHQFIMLDLEIIIKRERYKGELC